MNREGNREGKTEEVDGEGMKEQRKEEWESGGR